MYRTRQALILGLSFVLFLSSFYSWAGASEKYLEVARSFMDGMVRLSVESKNTQGSTSETSQKKVQELSDKIDFEQLAKKSFGSKWGRFKETERKDFISTLKELLEVTVYPKAQQFSAQSEGLRYSKFPGKENVVQVMGKIEREKKGDLIEQDLEIDLHVDAKSSKITDAIIEGELLSSNLKRQFDEALKKKSFSEVIAQMKKRVDESKKK